MSEQELLPCPWCNSTKYLTVHTDANDSKYCSIACNDCDAKGPLGFGHQKAKELWNIPHSTANEREYFSLGARAYYDHWNDREHQDIEWNEEKAFNKLQTELNKVKQEYFFAALDACCGGYGVEIEMEMFNEYEQSKLQPTAKDIHFENGATIKLKENGEGEFKGIKTAKEGGDEID